MKAFVFPGQGAQFVGMGKDLYANSLVAKEMFDKANEILGFNITDIMFEGSDEELKQTKVMIGDVNWLGEEQPAEAEFEVKLRSRQNLVAAKVRFFSGKQAEVTLLGDFYGAAAGQGCCFYQGSRVMGGGMIL